MNFRSEFSPVPPSQNAAEGAAASLRVGTAAPRAGGDGAAAEGFEAGL